MQKHHPTGRSQRPKALTVFAAAFIAGAAAAVGINRALDIHMAQAKTQVECEPIFVAIRPLPQGSPVTIWDVALRDWPKAMLPTTALRAEDRFEGMILKHPLREGQPLLSVQLVKAEQPPTAGLAAQVGERYVPTTIQPPTRPDADLWTPTAAPVAVAPPAPLVVADTVAAPTEQIVTSPAATPAAPIPAAEPASIATPDITTDVADATQPPETGLTETTVSDQPDAAATAPAVTTETDATAETTPSTTPPAEAVVEQAPIQAATPKRYLVVPERIASLADASFTTPAPHERTPDAAPQQQASQPSGGTAFAKKPKSVPPVMQAPTNRTRAQSSPPPKPQGVFGGMFPPPRLGVQPSPTRDGSSGQSRQPQPSKKPSSRTALWPWSAGGSK
ncbi:MAG: SAF domain-containing protein [Planctomycetia bacterium]